MCETPSWRLELQLLPPTPHKYLYLWSDHRTKSVQWWERIVKVCLINLFLNVQFIYLFYFFQLHEKCVLAFEPSCHVICQMIHSIEYALYLILKLFLVLHCLLFFFFFLDRLVLHCLKSPRISITFSCLRNAIRVIPHQSKKVHNLSRMIIVLKLVQLRKSIL